ncbi:MULTISPECIES: enolase C-terminal domain-like protein [Bradyrhizobium]|uniref:enolase C-terminal domain-like protein n=1 Tax=Bradyrhizobium TaxID=374 RepID=UPI0034E566B4
MATLDAVRKAVGDRMHLIVDYNQGLNLAEAIERCHAIDDYGLDWIEEPVVYDNLDAISGLRTLLRPAIPKPRLRRRPAPSAKDRCCCRISRRRPSPPTARTAACLRLSPTRPTRPCRGPTRRSMTIPHSRQSEAICAPPRTARQAPRSDL